MIAMGQTVTVGELIRSRRLAKGWTQTDLARETGLRQTYISQVEKGEIAMPRDHNLDTLGVALDLKRGDFYRAAGMIEEQVAAPRQVTYHTRHGDFTIDEDEAIAYVESKPDPIFQRQLDRWRQEKAPRAYRQFLLGIYLAWTSNADLAASSLDLADGHDNGNGLNGVGLAK